MDTIFALASASGRSGVAVIRISGENADDCFKALGTKIPKARVATLQTLKKYNSCDTLANNSTYEIIDKALVLRFPAPHSFTGENVVELHIHGSNAIIREIFEVLGKIPNFRMAEAGEFSRRAFYNNKMDMAEIEGLADLIDAETATQKRQAIRQMTGRLSSICNELREEIITLRSRIEAYLDFPDEELPEDILHMIDKSVSDIGKKVENILKDHNRGEKIREGIYISIIGEVNVGKSSLINRITDRDIAIVSDEAGTTRDIIEACINLDGIVVTFADTAGIRKNDINVNKIEAEGIRRSISRAKESDICLHIFDGSTYDIGNFGEIEELEKQQNVVVVFNKKDKTPQDILNKCKENNILCVSAKEDIAIDELLDRISEKINKIYNVSEDSIITRSRHREAFGNCLEHLRRFCRVNEIEIKAEELRLAGNELGKIVGVIEIDEVLDKLFNSFCIGK